MPSTTSRATAKQCIDTVRCISAALPEVAKSGHPGAPMGCAPIAHCLYGSVMKFSPKNPNWIARDRFVLSNGHACALQYTMLHLTGYSLSLEDLQNFRQVGSKCPGHPECHLTPGVEVVTGPLGQGVAQSVGLAIAAEIMATTYNKTTFKLFDSYIYCIVGDGCLQEGISSEACSLAGHLKLGRLIVLYDSNGISIDGSTNLSFTEDVAMRYRAYGWEVLDVTDGDHDVDGILNALEKGRENLNQPTLIICKTTIGYGSRGEGTEKVHGAPIGVDDIMRVREKFNLPPNDMFMIPSEVLQYYRERGEMGDRLCSEWNQLFCRYAEEYKNEYQELMERIEGSLPQNWLEALPRYTPGSKPEATRALSGYALNSLAKILPSIVGGSADLTGSNSTALKGEADFQPENHLGRYIRFGVREHGMAAICNGIFGFGGFRPFAGTFLNFISYAWGAVRLSALAEFGVLYIATHDSVELGEDGPTHQPIELAALCRATPNLIYYRPADGNEVSAGYAIWLNHAQTPTVLALCRSAVPHLCGSSFEGCMKGGYILEDFTSDGKPKCLLASCGSELHLCVEASKGLRSDFDVRIVSLPSWQLFLRQSDNYRHEIIPQGIKSLYVEAAATLGCERFFTQTIGMTSFGASGPKAKVWERFGFTPSNIEAVVRKMMI